MDASQLITIDLDPNIHLGPITLAWHGIFTAVGIFFGVWLAMRLIRPRVSEDDASAIAFWGVVAGIVGARVVHVFDCWAGCGGIPGGYLEHPELIPQIWTGGIAIWGAAIFGALGGLVVALRRKVPIGFGADAAAPGIALGFAIGRIGDIINGEHHAIACTAPWGLCVGFTNPATLGQPGPVHLVVAYDMALSLVAVAGAIWLRRARLPDGFIFWAFLAWYGLQRLLLGFLRVGDPTYAFDLREDQVIGVLVVAAAIPMLWRLRPRRSLEAGAV